MIERRKSFFGALPRALIAAVLCLCLLAPVSAVFLEVKEKGSIVSFDTENGTMTIAPDGMYECGYENDTRLCGWSPVSGRLVTGAVPDARVFSEFHVGDAVAATAVNAEGGRWIAVGRTVESADVPYATMIVGDPAKLPVSLAGDYALRYDTRPDCANSTGSVCPAMVANVTITSEGKTVLQQTLAPGETAFFNGRNDNSSVSVTFLGGQASAYDCSGGGQIIPPGPQPVSSFVVVVNPPIGFPAPSTQLSTPAPTTLALPALLPLIATGLVGILLRRRQS
ncbi:hypothetical protein [Methanofollis ethanolicus]|uniref:hypothetical protein n=1 Tax=Methanofollis ethanolicus TaxID=488124 RepID=UPI0008326273|nr:hypothetical protein [Methanofollis ethanolicus]